MQNKQVLEKKTTEKTDIDYLENETVTKNQKLSLVNLFWIFYASTLQLY